MAKLPFIRGQNGLLPDGDEASDWFAKLKPGALVFGNMVVPRNGKFHRKFFAMLTVCYGNMDVPTITVQSTGEVIPESQEAFRRNVTIKAGYWHWTIGPKNNLVPEADSIKFGSMDEAEFSKLYSAVVNVILQDYLPHWSVEDVDKAADNFVLGFG